MGLWLESFIHIQIDHCLERSAIAALSIWTVRKTLADIRAAVEDWQPDARRVCMEASDHHRFAASITTSAAGEDIDEVHAFLRWLCDDNFTFLGYREIDLEQKDDANVTSIRVIVRAAAWAFCATMMTARMFGGLRDLDEKRTNPPCANMCGRIMCCSSPKPTPSPACIAFCRWMRFLSAASTNTGTVDQAKNYSSACSRRKPMRRFRANIPLMRRKIADVVSGMNFSPTSHDGRS